MMSKIKTATLSVFMAALVLTPFLTFAQSPAEGSAAAQQHAANAGAGLSITQAELRAMSDAAELAKKQYLEKNDAWKQTEADAKEKCRLIGDELYTISGSVFTTGWTGPVNFHCFGGTYGVFGASFDQSMHNLLLGVLVGSVTEPITTENYQVWKKQRDANSQDPAWWEKALNTIFVGVANIIASVLAALAVAALFVLDYIIGWTNEKSTPQVVYTTWTTVRDFMNLMFIAAIIVMALATIIRYEAYNYKRLLRNLILMAILINFSLVIATTLIGFSNMLIHTLKPEGVIKEYGYGVVYPAFVTGGNGIIGGFLGWDYSFVAGLGTSVSKIVSLLFVTVSFAAIALLMLVRLVGLWFLVMVSPAAYALNILPSTQGMAKRWWDTFIKYLIWGPVAMFFLRLGLSLMTKTADGGTIVTGEAWLNNLFIAAFIWGGFMVAKSAGMYGASYITDSANKYAYSGSKFALSAYGNYFWRGSAARHLTTPLLGKDDAKKFGERVGKATAWIENEPRRQVQNWVTDPNKERGKLVEKQNRRSLIRRGYFKDISEEDAKKFSPEDFEYALRTADGMNDDVLKSLMEHGKPGVKMAIAEAFRSGEINKAKKLDAQVKLEVMGQVREHIWTKELGFRKSDMPKDFMPYNGTNGNEAFTHNGRPILVVEPKKTSDKDVVMSKDATFTDKVSKGKFEVDPTGAIRDEYRQIIKGNKEENKKPKIELNNPHEVTHDMPAEERRRRREDLVGDALKKPPTTTT